MPGKPTDKPRPQPLPKATLVPVGHHAGAPALQLVRPVLVAGSRHGCRIHLDSDTVSKAHALVVRDQSGTYIRDLCSRQHTLVNGLSIKEKFLDDEDTLTIGAFVFRFRTAPAKAPQQRAPAAALQIPGEPIAYPIEDRTVVIGKRKGCELQIVEDEVSTTHAVVFEMDGQHYVRDLGSRSGTFVNGKQVHQAELNFGDTLRIGKMKMTFVADVDEGDDALSLATADDDRADHFDPTATAVSGSAIVEALTAAPSGRTDESDPNASAADELEPLEGALAAADDGEDGESEDSLLDLVTEGMPPPKAVTPLASSLDSIEDEEAELDRLDALKSETHFHTSDAEDIDGPESDAAGAKVEDEVAKVEDEVAKVEDEVADESAAAAAERPADVTEPQVSASLDDDLDDALAKLVDEDEATEDEAPAADAPIGEAPTAKSSVAELDAVELETPTEEEATAETDAAAEPAALAGDPSQETAYDLVPIEPGEGDADAAAPLAQQPSEPPVASEAGDTVITPLDTIEAEGVDLVSLTDDEPAAHAPAEVDEIVPPTAEADDVEDQVDVEAEPVAEAEVDETEIDQPEADDDIRAAAAVELEDEPEAEAEQTEEAELPPPELGFAMPVSPVSDAYRRARAIADLLEISEEFEDEAEKEAAAIGRLPIDEAIETRPAAPDAAEADEAAIDEAAAESVDAAADQPALIDEAVDEAEEEAEQSIAEIEALETLAEAEAAVDALEIAEAEEEADDVTAEAEPEIAEADEAEAEAEADEVSAAAVEETDEVVAEAEPVAEDDDAAASLERKAIKASAPASVLDDEQGDDAADEADDSAVAEVAEADADVDGDADAEVDDVDVEAEHAAPHRDAAGFAVDEEDEGELLGTMPAIDEDVIPLDLLEDVPLARTALPDELDLTLPSEDELPPLAPVDIEPIDIELPELAEEAAKSAKPAAPTAEVAEPAAEAIAGPDTDIEAAGIEVEDELAGFEPAIEFQPADGFEPASEALIEEPPAVELPTPAAPLDELPELEVIDTQAEEPIAEAPAIETKAPAVEAEAIEAEAVEAEAVEAGATEVEADEPPAHPVSIEAVEPPDVLAEREAEPSAEAIEAAEALTAPIEESIGPAEPIATTPAEPEADVVEAIDDEAIEPLAEAIESSAEADEPVAEKPQPKPIAPAKPADEFGLDFEWAEKALESFRDQQLPQTQITPMGPAGLPQLNPPRQQPPTATPAAAEAPSAKPPKPQLAPGSGIDLSGNNAFVSIGGMGYIGSDDDEYELIDPTETVPPPAAADVPPVQPSKPTPPAAKAPASPSTAPSAAPSTAPREPAHLRRRRRRAAAESAAAETEAEAHDTVTPAHVDDAADHHDHHDHHEPHAPLIADAHTDLVDEPAAEAPPEETETPPADVVADKPAAPADAPLVLPPRPKLRARTELTASDRADNPFASAGPAVPNSFTGDEQAAADTIGNAAVPTAERAAPMPPVAEPAVGHLRNGSTLTEPAMPGIGARRSAMPGRYQPRGEVPVSGAIPPATFDDTPITASGGPRNRRLALLPWVLMGGLILAGGVASLVHSTVPWPASASVSLPLKNVDKLAKGDRDSEERNQIVLAGQSFDTANASLDATVKPGFLANKGEYDTITGRAKLVDENFVIKTDTDGRDVEAEKARLLAVGQALFKANQPKLDEIANLEQQLIKAQLDVDDARREMDRLTKKIVELKPLADSRPTTEERRDLDQRYSEAEKSWTAALSALKAAQIELEALEAAHAPAGQQQPSADQPTGDQPAGDAGDSITPTSLLTLEPEATLALLAEGPDDPYLAQLRKDLDTAAAQLKTLEAGPASSPNDAKTSLNQSLNGFENDISAAKDALADRPELAAYVERAQKLVEQIRRHTDTFIRRQEQQVQRLAEFKQQLDQLQAEQRRNRTDNDPELRDWKSKLQIAERQLSAARADGNMTDDVTRLEAEVHSLNNFIEARQEVLGRGDPTSNLIQQFEDVVTKTRKEMADDRAANDALIADLQQAFLENKPALGDLSEQQREATARLNERLSEISKAREQFAMAAADAQRETPAQVQQLRDRIADLNQLIDQRNAELAVQQEQEQARTKAMAVRQETLDAARRRVQSLNSDVDSAKAEFEAVERERRAMAARLSDASDALEQKTAAETRKATLENKLSTLLYESNTIRNKLATKIRPQPPTAEVTVSEDKRSQWAMLAGVGVVFLVGLYAIIELLLARRPANRRAARHVPAPALSTHAAKPLTASPAAVPAARAPQNQPVG